jgi:hypothetical protein
MSQFYMIFKKGYWVYHHTDLDFVHCLVIKMHKNAKAPVDNPWQFNCHNTTPDYGQNPEGKLSLMYLQGGRFNFIDCCKN